MTQNESITYTISSNSGTQYFTLKTGDQILWDRDKKEYYLFKFRDDPKNHYVWIPQSLRKHRGTYESMFLEIYKYFYPQEFETFTPMTSEQQSRQDALFAERSKAATAKSSGSSSSLFGGSLFGVDSPDASGMTTDPKKMIIIGGAVVFAVALAWSIIKG